MDKKLYIHVQLSEELKKQLTNDIDSVTSNDPETIIAALEKMRCSR